MPKQDKTTRFAHRLSTAMGVIVTTGSHPTEEGKFAIIESLQRDKSLELYNRLVAICERMIIDPEAITRPDDMKVFVNPNKLGPLKEAFCKEVGKFPQAWRQCGLPTTSKDGMTR